MAGQFFYDPNDIRYPPVLKSCIQVYRKYIADLLYDSLPVDQRYKRIIMANIQSGTDTVSRYNIDRFKQTNPVYPFTAYSIQDQEIDDTRKNHFGKSNNRLLEAANVYVKVIPYKVEIPMISFFTSGNDYLRARTILQKDAASLTRFYLPVLINGVKHQTSFNVDMQGPTKGDYAFEFDRYLRENTIYDIVHTSTIEYNEIIVETEGLYPVESKEVEIIPLTEEAVLEFVSSAAPVIQSISVNDDAVSVPRQPVQITFSQSMADDESIISQSIYFTPESEIEYSWNSDKTVLSVQPAGGFQANTLYVLEILPFMVNAVYVKMKEGRSINFRTGT